MKKILLLPALILHLAACRQPGAGTGQVISSKLDTTLIPKNVKYKGSIDTAVKFSDKEGEHVILTTEDDAIDTGHRQTGIYLHAYCYTIKDSKWAISWQLYDFTDECEFDISGGFLAKTFAITDLNHDGKAEVWLMYNLACRSDVSPSDVKIIMHEGSKKYALRGNSRVKVNATDYYGGDYKFDEAFKRGPKEFLLHAKLLWEKNLNEGFDESHPAGKFN